AGKWQPMAPADHAVRGYHLSQMYSPWTTWADLVAQHVAAKGFPEKQKVFVNCALGETWEEERTAPTDADTLMQRREVYSAQVPQGACLLTAGCDVQDDRIEAEIVGWGREEECWSIRFFILHGDPVQPDLWTELDGLLTREYRHEPGFKLSIQACCIDS